VNMLIKYDFKWLYVHDTVVMQSSVDSNPIHCDVTAADEKAEP